MDIPTVTFPLTHKETKDGICIYEHTESKIVFFSLETDSEKIICCPDNRSAFESIAIYPTAVVGKLITVEPEDADTYRIYIRETGQWLAHPQTGDTYNFGTVFEVHQKYIHMECVEIEHKEAMYLKRVYSLEQSKWVAVPYFDLGLYNPIKDFKKVSVGQFQKRPCLILEQERAKNPLSVFFLDTGEYFSIPNSLDTPEKDRERPCTIFCHIFPEYAVVGFGNGMSNSINFYNIWKIRGNAYLENPDSHKPELKLKFAAAQFTEQHIAILLNEHNRYEVISTSTWQKIPPVEFTVTRKASLFSGASVTDGKMQLTIAGPDVMTADLE